MGYRAIELFNQAGVQVLVGAPVDVPEELVKSYLNQKLTNDINTYTRESHATILGQIPFDTAITHAMVQAQTILEYDPLSETSQAIQDIWKKAENRVFSQ